MSNTAFMPFILLLLDVIYFYKVVVIIAVVMSWLVSFGVVNIHNQFARSVVRVLDALTEPVFRQVRRIIPPISGLDISPLIVWFFLQFLTYSIYYYFRLV